MFKTYTNRQRREAQSTIGAAAFLATHRYVGSVTKRGLGGRLYTLHTYQLVG